MHSELSLFLVGLFLGLVLGIVLMIYHIRATVQLLDEVFEDEVIAPLRKQDAPRAYRLQSVIRAALERLERVWG